MADEQRETLGQRIRRLRGARGLSLAQVAGGDFSRAFLNQVEMGRSQPSTRVLRLIASRLGTPLDYLVEGGGGFLDRELAVEKARVAMARGNARRALAHLEPALSSQDWPLGSDARVCAAQALIALGRREEGERSLAAEEAVIRAHGDALRLRRLRAIRARRAFKPRPGTHVRLAEQSLRDGDGIAALEHYRAARHLLEA